MTIEEKKKILFSRFKENDYIILNNGGGIVNIFEAVELIRDNFNINIIDRTCHRKFITEYHSCGLRLENGKLNVEFGGHVPDSSYIVNFIQSILDEIEEKERIKEFGEVRASYNNAELEAILEIEADLKTIKFSLTELIFLKKVINNANAYATVLNFEK